MSDGIQRKKASEKASESEKEIERERKTRCSMLQRGKKALRGKIPKKRVR